MTILKGLFSLASVLLWAIVVLKGNDIEELPASFWRWLGAAALVQAMTLIWLCLGTLT